MRTASRRAVTSFVVLTPMRPDVLRMALGRRVDSRESCRLVAVADATLISRIVFADGPESLRLHGFDNQDRLDHAFPPKLGSRVRSDATSSSNLARRCPKQRSLSQDQSNPVPPGSDGERGEDAQSFAAQRGFQRRPLEAGSTGSKRVRSKEGHAAFASLI